MLADVRGLMRDVLVMRLQKSEASSHFLIHDVMCDVEYLEENKLRRFTWTVRDTGTDLFDGLPAGEVDYERHRLRMEQANVEMYYFDLDEGFIRGFDKEKGLLVLLAIKPREWEKSGMREVQAA